MAVLLKRDDREYLLERGGRLETDLGVIEVPATATPGETVETHLGETFRLSEPRLADLFDHLERSGAPMLPRDVGLVLGYTGVRQNDRVLDVGTGTGILAIALGQTAETVISYERNEEFATIARENIRLADVADRVTIRAEDVLTALDELTTEPRFNVMTLDTQDAPTIVERAPELLVHGGVIAIYSPFMEAARRAAEVAEETALEEVDTLETIQREMDFDSRGTRPTTAGVGHSGYLTLARRS